MYSIIIPCYRSAETIETVVETTAAEMERLGRRDFEFVLVDDCSPDQGATLASLRELAARLPYVKVVGLAKNSGQHNAIMAGLREASGDVFISMDDDGQTRPSELHKMFVAFDSGYDVVYGAYPIKKENLFRRFGSWFNKMCSVVFLGRPKDLRTSSFWIVRKYVRDAIVSYEGAHTYMLGLILRSTSNITQVEVQHFERESGTSGYTLRALLRLWSNMIGFTVKPLRIALKFGSAVSTASILAALYIFIHKLIHPTVEAGWSSIMVGIFFSLGVQLTFIGLIGEYVGRTYMHINKEPQYIVKERHPQGGDSVTEVPKR
ncbi:MAG: glycosyltransferase family 2 protein [Acidobacteriota bacterium]|nr:glycosyltransferase family 2 protein [Acidobacteriota bacterium]